MEDIALECESCTGAKFTIVILDPLLKKVLERSMKEGTIERLHKEEVIESDIFYGKVLKSQTSEAAIAIPYMPYLGDLIYSLKSFGIKNFIFLDTATSLRPFIKIGSLGVVYAAQLNGFPSNYPLVADLALLTQVMEVTGSQGFTSFTTFIPRQDLPNILDTLKKREFDVVDKNSAIVYSICHRRIRCVVIDLIDSSIAKGIEKYGVWSRESKYYEGVLDSFVNTLNTLLGLELD